MLFNFINVLNIKHRLVYCISGVAILYFVNLISVCYCYFIYIFFSNSVFSVEQKTAALDHLIIKNSLQEFFCAFSLVYVSRITDAF